MPDTENASTGHIRVVRARIDSLSVFEITDNELKTLERGGPSSIYLNFAILLLSVGFSFLISLLTVDIQSVKIFSVFMVFAVIGLLGGIILLFLWRRQKGDISEVIENIQKRVPSSEITKVDE